MRPALIMPAIFICEKAPFGFDPKHVLVDESTFCPYCYKPLEEHTKILPGEPRT